MPFANPPVPLTSTAPVQEATAPAVGNAAAAARGDHVHARLTSTTVQALQAGGNATVMFTRSFSTMPGISCTAFKPTDNLPVSFEVPSWIQDAQNNYIGCVIHGSKAQTLPLVIGLLGTLVGYNAFAGDSTGTQFSCIAILASG